MPTTKGKRGRRPGGDGVVYEFVRKSNLQCGQRDRPCLGFGSSQATAIYNQPPNANKDCKFRGQHYHIDWEKLPQVHVVKIDADFWKTQFQECLAMPAVDVAGHPNPVRSRSTPPATTSTSPTRSRWSGRKRPEKQFQKDVGETIVWRREHCENFYGNASYLAKTAGHFLGRGPAP